MSHLGIAAGQSAEAWQTWCDAGQLLAHDVAPPLSQQTSPPVQPDAPVQATTIVPDAHALGSATQVAPFCVAQHTGVGAAHDVQSAPLPFPFPLPVFAGLASFVASPPPPGASAAPNVASLPPRPPSCPPPPAASLLSGVPPVVALPHADVRAIPTTIERKNRARFMTAFSSVTGNSAVAKAPSHALPADTDLIRIARTAVEDLTAAVRNPSAPVVEIHARFRHAPRSTATIGPAASAAFTRRTHAAQERASAPIGDRAAGGACAGTRSRHARAHAAPVGSARATRLRGRTGTARDRPAATVGERSTIGVLVRTRRGVAHTPIASGACIGRSRTSVARKQTPAVVAQQAHDAQVGTTPAARRDERSDHHEERHAERLHVSVRPPARRCRLPGCRNR
jgi:hypothetical protein